MTKLDYIGDVLCATALDFRHCDNVSALRGVIKTLQAVCEELDKIAARMQWGEDGGESVTNPTPAPVMPPQNGVADPLAKIRAMARKGDLKGEMEALRIESMQR